MSQGKPASLSKKSLVKVWAWCEENPGDPLSEAYMNACHTCGMIDAQEISRSLKVGRADGDYRYILEWGKIYDAAFVCRDTIGRVILDNLKRIENAQKSVQNFTTAVSEPA